MLDNAILTPVEHLSKGFIAAKLDRREDGPRKAARWAARCTLLGGLSFDATVENVSAGGVCFRSQQDPIKFGVGDLKKLRIYIQVECILKGKRHNWSAVLQLRHVSIANNEYRCGCSFVRIQPEDSRMLHRYIHNLNNSLPNLCAEHN
jgi:hypothetical protein